MISKFYFLMFDLWSQARLSNQFPKREKSEEGDNDENEGSGLWT